MTGIFSRYSQGENRVTASLTAVLRLLSLPALSYFLESFSNDSSEDLVSIVDQPSAKKSGVPDAEISSSFLYLLETKVTPDSFSAKQMDNHLARLRSSKNYRQKILIFLTPDDNNKEFVRWVAKNNADDEALHLSFAQMHDTIDTLLLEDTIALSDTEEFLLKSLMTMIEAEGLLGRPEDTVVVAAGRSYEANINNGIYVCQAGRTFRDVKYIAFYKDGEIKTDILKLGDAPKSCEVSISELEKSNDKKDKELLVKLRSYIAQMGLKHDTPEDKRMQVFTGSIKKLNSAITNDLTAKKSSRRVAYTQGQRYVEKAKLESASKTSDLVIMAE